MTVQYSAAAVRDLMKILYPKNRVEKLTYMDHTFLSLVKKNEKFGGSSMEIPLIFANSQARSAVFGTAQAAAANASFAAKGFLLTRVKDYQVFAVDNESIEASQSEDGAFAKLLDTEMESAFSNMGQSLSMAAYGDGTGTIGSVGSFTATGATVTLANINDVTNFEVGQSFGAAATRGGALRNAGALLTITAINRDTGVLTNSGAIAAIANGDFLSLAGDGANAGANVRMSGIAAWIPTAAPSATLFFNVDRTADVTRLGGLRFDATGLNFEEATIAALSRLYREGGRADYWFVNPFDYRGFATSLGSKVESEYMEVGEVGFQTIGLVGPAGKVKLASDRDCPAGIGYPLTMKSWSLNSLGKAPHILNLDGTDVLRQATADAWEGRIGFYGQIGCNAPGHNMVVTMPT